MKYNSAKISDKISKYYETGNVTISQFMTPAEIKEVNSELKEVEHKIWGGLKDAERKIIFIGTSEPNYEEYMNVIRITADMEFTHRSVLGSIMNTGVKREVIGDIIVGEECSDVIVMKSIAKFLLLNLRYVGKEKVKVEEVALNEIIRPEKEEKEIHASVSSLRVDAVISAGFGFPRDKSKNIVKDYGVKVNYEVTNNPMHKINKGDIISVRGKGRLVLMDILDKTKKGRTRIIVARQ